MGPRRSGWAVVARKEIGDGLLSLRFGALLGILALAAVGAVYAASTGIREVAGSLGDRGGLFLRLFTIQADPVPFPLVTFIGFLGPLLGIMFGFDAINAERSQRTLSRLLAQPIHRDDVINGKFVGSLTIITTMLVTLVAVVSGLGIVRLGIVPSADEVLRLMVWVLVVVAYVAVWLALAMLVSVLVHKAATSALVTVSGWLGITLFGSLAFRLIGQVIAPPGSDPGSILANVRAEYLASQLSPLTLFSEASSAMLDPSIRSVGVVTLGQLDQAVQSELGLGQSLLVTWPQIVGLVAVVVVLFALSYTAFMRQEVRA